MGHFQSACPQFQLNQTAAHHDIAKATVARLKDLLLEGWKIFYETTFDDLPFKFAWATEGEEEEQRNRRPDGVAWNEVEGAVVFIEFTRAMDNPDTMSEALDRKGHQYDAAVQALIKAQRSRSTRHSSRIHSVTTAPLIFGVRGTVLLAEARESLGPLNLREAQLRKVLAAGVRAAITAASDLCTARAAALRCLPKAPRGPDGRKVKVVIPPKPQRQSPWRGDRGRGW